MDGKGGRGVTRPCKAGSQPGNRDQEPPLGAGPWREAHRPVDRARWRCRGRAHDTAGTNGPRHPSRISRGWDTVPVAVMAEPGKRCCRALHELGRVHKFV